MQSDEERPGRRLRVHRTSRPGRTTRASEPRPSRSPSAATRGSGRNSITPSLLIAYIWIWAGFAMVVIAAGLAAMPRDVLEAARTDGATEWQVFRRVTVPLLAPGSERRLHHDDHQRPQGVRHRDRPRAGVDAGERERDRARDVADVVQRRSTSAPARRSPSSSSCSSCPCSRSTSDASGESV